MIQIVCLARCSDPQAKYFKKRLFYVVNGLDRGSSASAAAVSEVEATVASLLSVSSPVDLSWAAGKNSVNDTRKCQKLW